jgi:hypothetical protein
MASGIENQLTKQIGEHLVVAELGRRKIIATPFAGNVPDIDILAYAKNKTAAIQVKAINQSSWQFNIENFLNIELAPKKQIVTGKRRGLNRKIICIFVAIDQSQNINDEFYIFNLGWLQDYFYKTYKGRRKPHNINSFHCAIWKKDISKYLGNWNLIEKCFL